MIRAYFCQTESGLAAKDRITVGTNETTDKLVFGFESETAPCNVYLNTEQIENLVELLTTWLAAITHAERPSKPVLWKDGNE